MIDLYICFTLFAADVWGSVSDWAMVIVTTGTAIVIWRTLLSQTTVQKLQLKLTQIENLRFIREQKLGFNIEVTESLMFSLGEGEHRRIHKSFTLSITLLNADCENFSMSADSKNAKLTFRNDQVFEAKTVSENSTLKLHINAALSSEDYDNKDNEITINLIFSDLVKNTYHQNAKFIFRKGIYKISVDDKVQLKTT